MKKNKDVLIIFGSPHKNGHCKKLMHTVFEVFSKEDCEIFSPFKMQMNPCIDCGVCKENDECAFGDLNEFYDDLENCGKLIIISPIYNSGYPSPLKALVDRLQRYYNARFARNIRPPIKKEKKAVLILSSGSDGEEEAKMIEKQTKKVFTVINSELIETVLQQNTDYETNDMSEKIKNACVKIKN